MTMSVRLRGTTFNWPAGAAVAAGAVVAAAAGAVVAAAAGAVVAAAAGAVVAAAAGLVGSAAFGAAVGEAAGPPQAAMSIEPIQRTVMSDANGRRDPLRMA
jgi:hypothetical protein